MSVAEKPPKKLGRNQNAQSGLIIVLIVLLGFWWNYFCYSTVAAIPKSPISRRC